MAALRRLVLTILCNPLQGRVATIPNMPFPKDRRKVYGAKTGSGAQGIHVVQWRSGRYAVARRRVGIAKTILTSLPKAIPIRLSMERE